MSTVQNETQMHVSHDFAGPRYSWDLVSTEDERLGLELYAGEWSTVYTSMQENCCWSPDHRNVCGFGDALGYCFTAVDPLPVNEVASAQLAMAQFLGGHKRGAMMRSMRTHLAKRGMRLA